MSLHRPRVILVDPETSCDRFCIQASGLEIRIESTLETGDEVWVNLETEREWEILYRGGSEPHMGTLILRRVI